MSPLRLDPNLINVLLKWIWVLVPGKTNFWKTSLQKNLFFKIVPEPTFLLICPISAYVADVDCVMLATCHPVGNYLF